MTIEILALDEGAIRVLDAALIEDSWFHNFYIPDNSNGLRRTQIGNTVYLLSEDANKDGALLLVRTGSNGIFASASKPRTAFERILRVALRHFDRSISLPVLWQAYHEGSRLSVFADPFVRKSQRRMYFEQAPEGSDNIYAFAVTDTPRVLSQVPIDIPPYKSAVQNLPQALAADDKPKPPDSVGQFGILLSTPLGIQLAKAGTLDEWYRKLLNPEQLRFVNQRLDRPIRLRGAAGTGKTQAMTVRCLRDLYADAAGGGNRSFAFLTHSSALAHDVVRGMIYALDPSQQWQRLRTPNGRPRLWIGTLYELAQEQLNYERKGLNPLSLDGRDGRELQRFLISDAIEVVRREPRLALGLLKDCPEFARQLADDTNRSRLIEELMNEFACVLDADNVRKGTPEADRYLKASREPWQMNLPSEAHRKIALEIHGAYRELLRGERLLSMDQMIADFGRYLSTHEWNQLRDRDGFDEIFVDEYHYFTRVEAMTLQYLFASRAEISGRWPLIMAYDLKQSVNDAAISGGIERFRNPGVGESIKVDLKDVHRSSPEIATFLSDLDAAFPAIDLEGEFDTYAAKSKNIEGGTPELLTFDTNIGLIDEVLDRACKAAKSLSAGGRQVAVLCMSEDLFDQYRNAGRTQGKIVAVTSREDLRELSYAKSKCVFSMPEYVAGLQFDTVFLIHVDQVDFSDEALSQGARRRYVSRAYLGASRAVSSLVVASSLERGGRSAILDAPVKNGSLRTVPV